jgi:hypothetical protein
MGVRASLLADAATFAASALLVWAGVTARPAARAGGSARPRPLADMAAGTRLVFATPALLVPMLFGWLAALYNSPEGIAAPLARALAGGPATTGLLLAVPALGYTCGALGFGRCVPGRRRQLMRPLAIACCATLMLAALRPGLPGMLVVLGVSGACACYQVAANAAFVASAPAQQRSQAFGLAAGGMSLGQGAAMVLAGAALHFATVFDVVAGAGAIGAAAAIALTILTSRKVSGL